MYTYSGADIDYRHTPNHGHVSFKLLEPQSAEQFNTSSSTKTIISIALWFVVIWSKINELEAIRLAHGIIIIIQKQYGLWAGKKPKD